MLVIIETYRETLLRTHPSIVFIYFYFILLCHVLISSPEHEVLMVSYCGQWLSVVVRRVSCVVRRPSCVNI